VQLPPEPKVPAPLEVKLTVPVGVVAVPPGVVSVTVAVQLVVPPTGSVSGEQLTLVVVVCLVAVTTVVPLEPRWVVSPL
jgi:hypothetical protein